MHLHHIHALGGVMGGGLVTHYSSVFVIAFFSVFF